MDWGTVLSIVLGAILGAAASLVTTEVTYRRTRSDQVRDVKLSTFAQYLSALKRFPLVAEQAESGHITEVDALIKEMADLEAMISLRSPKLHQVLDDAPNFITDDGGRPLAREERRSRVKGFADDVRKAMEQELGSPAR
jgi:hypothetical protein